MGSCADQALWLQLPRRPGEARRAARVSAGGREERLEAEGDFQLFCPQESAAQALGTLVAWCFEREHPTVELRDVENRLSMGDVTLWALRRGRGADDEVLLAQAAGNGLADLERRCDGSLYDELEGNGRRCETAFALADAIAAGEALPLLSTKVSVGDVLATDGADLRYTTYASSVDLAGRIELLAASYDDLRSRLEREYAELRATLDGA